MKRAFYVLMVAGVTGTLTTLAAPAGAMTPLEAAQDYVDNVSPSNDTWGTGCTMVWGNIFFPYMGETVAACFFTLSLKHAYPTYTNAMIKSWWGMNSPSSPVYYEAVLNENKFVQIDPGSMLPGDLIVVRYSTSSGAYTGHTMIVEESELDLNPPVPQTDVAQLLVTVLDSTTTPHGSSDSRWSLLGSHQGAGRGEIRLYVNDPDQDTILAHAWSTATWSTTYPNCPNDPADPGNPACPYGREILIGRFTP